MATQKTTKTSSRKPAAKTSSRKPAAKTSSKPATPAAVATELELEDDPYAHLRNAEQERGDLFDPADAPAASSGDA